MAASRALRRLLRIRKLEEERSRVDLEVALAQLQILEDARKAATERGRMGRSLVAASARSGELTDRLAGLEETRCADHLVKTLAMRIETAERVVVQLRNSLLAKRVECRQVEILIEKADAHNAIEAGRRGQQGLDEWHRSRRKRDI